MLYLLSISYMPYTKLETYKHPVGKHQHSQSLREECFRRLQGSHKPHGCQWELSLVLGLPGSKVYTQPSSLSTIQFHPTAIVGCSFFFETESQYIAQAGTHYIAQAGLELMILSLPSTGMTDLCHSAKPSFSFFTHLFAFI